MRVNLFVEIKDQHKLIGEAELLGFVCSNGVHAVVMRDDGQITTNPIEFTKGIINGADVRVDATTGTEGSEHSGNGQFDPSAKGSKGDLRKGEKGFFRKTRTT